MRATMSLARSSSARCLVGTYIDACELPRGRRLVKLVWLLHDGRVRGVHLDNAGEFLSREFTEYLESESIARTTCPPHVHQLNGVAERAIRSVMEIVRATREASACPIGFWPHLVEHAVDVLNRVTGPPCESGHEMSAYEAVTGQKPKILNIMPIGADVRSCGDFLCWKAALCFLGWRRVCESSQSRRATAERGEVR